MELHKCDHCKHERAWLNPRGQFAHAGGVLCQAEGFIPPEEFEGPMEDEFFAVAKLARSMVRDPKTAVTQKDVQRMAEWLHLYVQGKFGG